jgi:hypothetical protein
MWLSAGRAEAAATPPKSPGMLASHYAPELPLRLDAHDVRPREALLAFGAWSIAGAAALENLSPGGDLVEAAANLFAMLRALDRPGLAGLPSCQSLPWPRPRHQRPPATGGGALSRKRAAIFLGVHGHAARMGIRRGGG